MSPTVIAALIAVVGTVVVAMVGFLTTRKAIQTGHEDTGKTLKEQRARTLNERFATAADRLGSDKSPAVRLAGVHALTGLADDWPENRQTCVDVLCAYLRIPYKPDPGEQGTPEERLAFEGEREVRHTVIRLIATHLRQDALVSWQGLNFDFRGVVFDGGDFGNAEFSGGTIDFADAVFSGGFVNLSGAAFSGGTITFGGAAFSGGEVNFMGAVFSGAEVYFGGAKFSGGEISFGGAKFSGGQISFSTAEFSGGAVDFGGAVFSGGAVDFTGAVFSGSEVDFYNAKFFRGGTVNFTWAKFSGGTVDFGGAIAAGGTVDFSTAADWSHPPVSGWLGAPPPGVLLPREADHAVS